MFETSEFITSAVKKEQYPNHQHLPEFVFMGRSNVGKSSLINALCQKKLLAKVSSKPGETITLNFFLIDKQFYFVDVPGYGYAVQSKVERLNFGKYIEEYLTHHENLKYAFLLVDTKVGPTKDDLLMYDYLQYFKVPTYVVSTKSDKVGTTKLHQHKKMILEKIPTDHFIMTSTMTKKGLEELKNIILESLS